jgi:gas vesicle protein
MRSNSAGDGLIMFLVGFAFGAGAALLAAPQSGKKTRRMMSRKAEDARETLEEIGEELVERGREMIERGRSAAEEKLGAVRG